jgi:hypothetical protein
VDIGQLRVRFGQDRTTSIEPLALRKKLLR